MGHTQERCDAMRIRALADVVFTTRISHQLVGLEAPIKAARLTVQMRTLTSRNATLGSDDAPGGWRPYKNTSIMCLNIDV